MESLDARHTGEYLAKKLHECLEKYGLEKHVSSPVNPNYPRRSPLGQMYLLVMDGAGNCNTTATSLGTLNPRFKGTAWRGYCFLHIIQLSAKVRAILFFFCPSLLTRT
jgi:hypothetical protein